MPSSQLPPTPQSPERFHVRKPTSVLSALAAAALILPAFSSPARAKDGPAPHPTAGTIVYTESNDPRPGQNAVLAFRVNSDSTLTPLGAFPTGGAGVGNPDQVLGPDDSDQEVIINPDDRLLFAVNGGSNSIAVFHIAVDGTLDPTHGSPFPSGGTNPVSVGLSGDRLYVVNKDMDPAQGLAGDRASYTAFRVGGDGHLSPIPHSTVPAPAGSSPSQALVSPSGGLLFDAQFMAGQLASFDIAPNGRLIAAPGSPQALPDLNPNKPELPLGLAAHPSLPLLYADVVSLSEVAVYRYDATGALTFLTAVADSGKAPCWARVNADGTRLYASNTGDNSIAVYSLADPAAPVQIQRLALTGPGSIFQIGLDPSGKHLFVVSQRTTTDPSDPTGNGLHVLDVAADGTLTEAASSPIALSVPPSARPQGIATFQQEGQGDE